MSSSLVLLTSKDHSCAEKLNKLPSNRTWSFVGIVENARASSIPHQVLRRILRVFLI